MLQTEERGAVSTSPAHAPARRRAVGRTGGAGGGGGLSGRGRRGGVKRLFEFPNLLCRASPKLHCMIINATYVAYIVTAGRGRLLAWSAFTRILG